MQYHTLVGAACALLPCSSSFAQSFVDVTANTPMVIVPNSTVPTSVGVACGDFDRDGDQDIITAGNPNQPLYYFRNDGAMTFTNATVGCGLGTAAVTHGFAVGDIDNDGDLDLFVCNYRSPGRLFINDGTGHFTEQAAARGIVHNSSNFSANFGDYDRDGWLDLYLGNHFDQNLMYEANILYRNVGGGYFVDVTAAAGCGDTAATFASAFLDYNEDGWPDIITANDKRNLLPNSLYRNNGDGTFTSVGPQVGADLQIDGMGVDYTDAFNDGGVDVYFSDTPPDHVFMVWDAAQSRYFDLTTQYGMVAATPAGWAVNFLDYDNDGWQDVYIVHSQGLNHCYHNPGQPASAFVPWPDTAFNIGLATHWEQFSTITADFDNDGGIDFCHRYQLSGFANAPYGVGLLHNQTVRGNWLKFATRGTVSNRDGIGARIVVVTGTQRQRQWVRSGTGFMGSSDLRVHFGLGTAPQADLVEITWPSGQVQILDNVAANQILEVVEPSFTLAAPVAAGGTSTLNLSIQGDHGLMYGMVLAFSDTPRSQLPDGRFLPLHLDGLSNYTFIPGNTLLLNPLGLLDANGQTSSTIAIPNQPGLVGVTFFATAATVAVHGLPGIRTIFPEPVRITIQ